MLYLSSYANKKFRSFREDWSFVDLTLDELMKETIAYKQVYNDGLISVPCIRPEWVLLKTEKDIIDFADMSKKKALKSMLADIDDCIYLQIVDNNAFYRDIKNKYIVDIFPRTVFIRGSEVFTSICVMHDFEDRYELGWRGQGIGVFRKQVIDGYKDRELFSLYNKIKGVILHNNTWYYRDMTTSSSYRVVPYERVLTTRLELL